MAYRDKLNSQKCQKPYAFRKSRNFIPDTSLSAGKLDPPYWYALWKS